MASPELQIVIDMLRATDPMGSNDVFQIREGMKVAEQIYQPPEDARYEPVDAGGVAAEWTAVEGVDESGVVVYLHGGGYTVGGIGSHRGLCTNLSRAAGLPVLNVDYRLAPESPYPAAVDDAVAAVRYVRERGIDPSRIAVAGDSAGGGLTVCALLALRDAGDPSPAAGVCISPWTDLSLSGKSIDEKESVDPLVSRPLLEMMAGHYLAGGDPRAATASPLFADLAGLPPLLVHVGTAECLLDDATVFADRAREAGVDVELEVWEDMIHVWHTFADNLPEGRRAIEGIAGFLSAKLG